MAKLHGESARVYLRRLTMTLGVILAAAWTSACGDACEALAKEICRCGRTQNEQDACVQRINNDTSVARPTEAQKAECERLLDECTCDKLGQGDLAACGLAYQ
ncbi:MAG: hypothetical protein ACAI38_22760 [Myxococcota bacterium]